MSVKQKRGSKSSIQLTSGQCNMIRTFWTQLMTSKGPNVLGTAIMQRFFFKAPLVKESFNRCPLPAGYTNHDKLLKEHAKSVATLIDTVIKSMDNLEGVAQQLEDLGRKHAHLFEYGFTPKFWNVFAEAFIDCTLEWGEKSRRSEESRKAWALIINFIVDRIKEGYHGERKEKDKMQQRRSSMTQQAGALPLAGQAAAPLTQQPRLSVDGSQKPPLSPGYAPAKRSDSMENRSLSGPGSVLPANFQNKETASGAVFW